MPTADELLGIAPRRTVQTADDMLGIQTGPGLGEAFATGFMRSIPATIALAMAKRGIVAQAGEILPTEDLPPPEEIAAAARQMEASLVPQERPGFKESVAGGLGTIMGDLPFYVAGGAGAASLVRPMLSKVPALLGKVAGRLAGSIGAFETPAVVREAAIQAGEGEFEPARFAKEMGIGGATGTGVGVASLIPNPLLRVPAEVVAMVGAESLLREGRLPTLRDLLEGGVTIAALQAAFRVAGLAFPGGERAGGPVRGIESPDFKKAMETAPPVVRPIPGLVREAMGEKPLAEPPRAPTIAPVPPPAPPVAVQPVVAPAPPFSIQGSVSILAKLPQVFPEQMKPPFAKAGAIEAAQASIAKGRPGTVEITITDQGPLVTDGRHTLIAAQEAGLETLPVRIVQKAEILRGEDLRKATEWLGLTPSAKAAKPPVSAPAVTSPQPAPMPLPSPPSVPGEKPPWRIYQEDAARGAIASWQGTRFLPADSLDKSAGDLGFGVKTPLTYRELQRLGTISLRRLSEAEVLEMETQRGTKLRRDVPLYEVAKSPSLEPSAAPPIEPMPTAPVVATPEPARVGVGDPVEYRPKLSDRPITGAVSHVNPDGTVNIRARAGGVIRNVPAEKVTPLLTPDEVGLDSTRIGKRVALGPDDKAILGEMRQTLSDVGGEVGQKIFLEGGEVGRGGDVTVKGFKTGKPSWMEIPDSPGEYYKYPEFIKVLESLRKGRWPKTAKQVRIAEQLLQEVRFDAEEEKGRLALWERQALESETAPALQPSREQGIQDAFFAEVDRLAAEEAGAVRPITALTVGQRVATTKLGEPSIVGEIIAVHADGTVDIQPGSVRNKVGEPIPDVAPETVRPFVDRMGTQRPPQGMERRAGAITPRAQATVSVEVNFPAPKPFQQSLAALGQNETLRTQFGRLGITGFSVESPHEFGLSEQANIEPGTGRIRVSADAGNPANSVAHELAHDIYNRLPEGQRGAIERYILDSRIEAQHAGGMAERIADHFADVMTGKAKTTERIRALFFDTPLGKRPEAKAALPPTVEEIAAQEADAAGLAVPVGQSVRSWQDVAGAGGYITDKDNLREIVKQHGDFPVRIKDVRGGRHVMPASVAADVLDSSAGGYVREVSIVSKGGDPYYGSTEGLKGELAQFGSMLKTGFYEGSWNIDATRKGKPVSGKDRKHFEQEVVRLGKVLSDREGGTVPPIEPGVPVETVKVDTEVGPEPLRQAIQQAAKAIRGGKPEALPPTRPAPPAAPSTVTLGSLGGAFQEAAGYLPESIRNLPAKYRSQIAQPAIDYITAKMPKVLKEARGLGQEVVDLRHDRGATLANYIERAVELSGKLQEGLTPAEKARVDQVLRGGITTNPAIERLVNPVRGLIDELQAKLVKYGYLTPEDVQMFQERFRSHPEYLRRLYETKLVPPDQPLLAGEMTGPVGRGVKSEALMMRGDIQRVKLPLMGGEPLVGAQRAEFLAPWLKKGYRLIQVEGDTATIFRDIPELIRKAMGEIRTQPGFVAAKTAAEQARIVANHEFLAKIAENPEWAKPGLTDAELASNEWTRLTGDKKKWGPLADMFVKKEVALEVQSSLRLRQDWEKVIGRLVGMWKFGKVIVNPAAMGRNIISSGILADFGGLHPWMVDEWAKGSADFARQSGLWGEAKKMGLFRSTYTANEIMGLADGLARSSNPNAILRVLDGMHEIAEATGKKTGIRPAAIYGTIENFYRYNLYRYYREGLGLTPVEARREALKYAIDYEVVSPAVAALRGTGGGWAAPLFALGGSPFVTFSAKAIPLTLETAALHPLRVGKYLALIYGVSKLAGSQIGQREEETTAQRQLGQLNPLRYALLPWRDKDGRAQYYDLGYTLPFGDLIEMLDVVGGGQGRRANVAFLPVVGHPTFAVAEAILNKSGFTGKELSAPSDTALQSIQKRVGHIYQSWMPSLAPPAPGLEKGGFGYEDLRRAFATPPETDFLGRTRSPVAALLANVAGLRARGVTTAELANFKARQYDEMFKALDKELIMVATRFQQNPEEADRRIAEIKQRYMEIAKEAQALLGLIPPEYSRPGPSPPATRSSVPAVIQQAMGAGS